MSSEACGLEERDKSASGLEEVSSEACGLEDWNLPLFRSPPTVTQLAALGKQSRASAVADKPVFDLGGINPIHFPRATELQGSLKRLKEFCEKNDPSDIAKAFKPHEIQPLRDCISVIENWILLKPLKMEKAALRLPLSLHREISCATSFATGGD